MPASSSPTTRCSRCCARAAARRATPCRRSSWSRPVAASALDITPLDEFIEAFIEHDPGRALTVVALAVQQGRDPRTLTDDIVRHLRDCFLSLMAPELVQLPAQRADEVSALAQRMGAAAIVRAMERLGEMLVEMRHAPDPRLLLEVALVQLTHEAASNDIVGAARSHRTARAPGRRPAMPPAPAARPRPSTRPPVALRSVAALARRPPPRRHRPPSRHPNRHRPRCHRAGRRSRRRSGRGRRRPPAAAATRRASARACTGARCVGAAPPISPRRRSLGRRHHADAEGLRPGDVLQPPRCWASATARSPSARPTSRTRAKCEAAPPRRGGRHCVAVLGGKVPVTLVVALRQRRPTTAAAQRPATWCS